jgi:hypothetical protein
MIVHAGESIPIIVEMHPSFLSTMFPFVTLDPPSGTVSHGDLTGSPYQFTIDLPANLEPGAITTSATARMAQGVWTSMRSNFLKFIVE